MYSDLSRVLRKGKAGSIVAAVFTATVLTFLGMTAAFAQVQRSFVNPGFEQPGLGSTACWIYLAESQVPGWRTSHSPYANPGSGTCVFANPGPPNSPIIEIWTNGFNSATAIRGQQFAELNAAQSSRISQVMCLLDGDEVDWAYIHRGRDNPTVRDVMHFMLGTQEVVRVGTTNNGTGGIVSTTLGTATTAAEVNGWRHYSGNFTYSGAEGPQNFGFGSISTGGGNISTGNFIDDIQVIVDPFVELSTGSFGSLEGAGPPADVPTLRISGVVRTPIAVQVVVTGGTATIVSDYTTPSGTNTFTVTVPADDYGDGTEIPLGFASIDDRKP